MKFGKQAEIAMNKTDLALPAMSARTQDALAMKAEKLANALDGKASSLADRATSLRETLED